MSKGKRREKVIIKVRLKPMKESIKMISKMVKDI